MKIACVVENNIVTNVVEVPSIDPQLLDNLGFKYLGDFPVIGDQVVNGVIPEMEERTTENLKVSLRSIRNRLLSESDWTQLSDIPLTETKKAEWATYRQALRDVPQQDGYPNNIVYPEMPS